MSPLHGSLLCLLTGLFLWQGISKLHFICSGLQHVMGSVLNAKLVAVL